MGLLFQDFSSEFNTVTTETGVHAGSTLSLCNWVLDYLTCRPQGVRISITPSTIVMNTGTPQGCVLNPLLFTINTNVCKAHLNQNLKFADTAVIGLIMHGDKSLYRWEVEDLTCWCRDNNLILNIQKTKEMIKYLELHLNNNLTWSTNTRAVRKPTRACTS